MKAFYKKKSKQEIFNRKTINISEDDTAEHIYFGSTKLILFHVKFRELSALSNGN